MNDLFAAMPKAETAMAAGEKTAERTEPRHESLAERMRPKRFEDVVGQDALLAPSSPFRRRIAADRIGAMILYGPPGTSKTTIARIVGAETGRRFRSVDGTKTKAEELRTLAREARSERQLLFVDEFHRVTIPRQEEFLSMIEDGSIQMIAATTGNPYHDIASGIVSRATVFRISALDERAQTLLYERTRDRVRDDDGIRRGRRRHGRRIRPPGRRRRPSAGHRLRELTVGRERGSRIALTAELVGESYDQAAVNHDKSGDQHYDVTSAFIKSMRGSDPDATLFWLARMIQAGEPPEYIARRILIHASEDVGLADNTCLETACAALTAVCHVGYPEAEIVLGHAALKIALAPKSNSAYRGIKRPAASPPSVPTSAFPPHLRDTHYAGAAKLGHAGYRFPHADARGWVEQVYLPDIPEGTLYESDAREAETWEKRANAYWSRIKADPARRPARTTADPRDPGTAQCHFSNRPGSGSPGASQPVGRSANRPTSD